MTTPTNRFDLPDIHTKPYVPYVKELPWLYHNTIYLCRHGSQAYGTNTPDSDLDLRGICVPPREYFLGYIHRFEQVVLKEPNDLTIFGLHKFAKLAADGNPNALEILFVDSRDILGMSGPGMRLLDNREWFLSKKIKHTMTGYAHSQLKRIQGHRAWLLNPPKSEPTRADFGLPERTVISADQLATANSLIRKQVEAWQLSLDGVDDASRIEFEGRIAQTLTEMQMTSDQQWSAAGRVIGMSENFLGILERERAYTNARRNWEQYQQWKSERNEKRAALEAKYGFDTKHGMHLIRLMESCAETLETGILKVRRDNAKELLGIRNGSLSYDQLMERADQLSKRVEAAYLTSTLPREPQRTRINELVMEITESML